MAKFSTSAGEGNAAFFAKIRDTGYQHYCIDCGGRHGGSPTLIGKERFLSGVQCAPCAVKDKKIPVDQYGFKLEKYDNGKLEEQEGQ